MKLVDTISSVLRQKGGDIYHVTPRHSVYDAIEMMADKHVGALRDQRGRKLVGVISERDYARKVILKGRASKETAVEEIMTSPVVYVSPAPHRGRLHDPHDREAHPPPAGRARTTAWWP